jgi:hypothetical protein
MPATYSYKEYANLLFVYGFCNAAVEDIGGDIHIAWSLITQYLPVYTDVGGRLVPALELIGNMFNRGVMTMFLMQYREAQPQVCIEFHAQQVFLHSSMENITF